MTGPNVESKSAAPHRHTIVVACALVAGVFGLYLWTLAPTISWGDSADLPLRVFGDRDLLGARMARDYALYRLIGRVFLHVPIGDVGYRLNLMSATFSVAAILIVFVLVVVRTERVLAASVAALALACSHTWWWMSVVSEVYTFAGFFVLAGLLLWRIWYERGGWVWLVAGACTSGLAVSAHAAGALVLVPVIWLVYRERHRVTAVQISVALAAGVAGGAGFLKVLALALMDGGSFGLFAAVDSANPAYHPGLLMPAAKAVALQLYQFPLVGTLLGAAGLGVLWRSPDPWDRVLLATWTILFGWGLVSRVPDAFNAFAFSYAAFAPIIGVGGVQVIEALERGRRLRAQVACGLLAAIVLIPPALYAATPAVLDRMGIDATGARRCPGRDNNWYFLYPPKRSDYAPLRYAEEALDAVGDGGVLIADYTLWRPLSFVQQVVGRRTDVTLQIVDPYLAGNALSRYLTSTLRTRRVYLAAIDPLSYYDVPQLEEAFVLQPAGPVFEVRVR